MFESVPWSISINYNPKSSSTIKQIVTTRYIYVMKNTCTLYTQQHTLYMYMTTNNRESLCRTNSMTYMQVVMFGHKSHMAVIVTMYMYMHVITLR